MRIIIFGAAGMAGTRGRLGGRERLARNPDLPMFSTRINCSASSM